MKASRGLSSQSGSGSGEQVIPDPNHCGDDEKPAGFAVPGIYSTQAINTGGGFQGFGTPNISPNQTEFYEGPWSPFNMQQSEFWSFIGAPMPFQGKADWNGVFHLDDNGIAQDRSENVALHDVSGEGFLYVDGDLELDSSFHFRGLIYVEGDLRMNGSAWVLGAVIVKGESQVTTNGNMTLLYSKDTVEQMMSKYAGRFATISWREE